MNPGPLTLRPLWSVLMGLVLLIVGQHGPTGNVEDRGPALAPLSPARALFTTGRCVSGLAATESDGDTIESERFQLLQAALHTPLTFPAHSLAAFNVLADPPPPLEFGRRAPTQHARAPPA